MAQKILLSGFLIILSTFLIGCEETNPTKSTTITEIVPGQLDVHFAQNVTIPKANAFLSDLTLQPIDLSSLASIVESNWTVVGVLEGEERFWTKRLIRYPEVNAAKQKTRTTLIQ